MVSILTLTWIVSSRILVSPFFDDSVQYSTSSGIAVETLGSTAVLGEFYVVLHLARINSNSVQRFTGPRYMGEETLDSHPSFPPWYRDASNRICMSQINVSCKFPCSDKQHENTDLISSNP